ncbi:very short patch repair endonuclease [Flavobacterium cerinum]|uniref:Very short patch repair endonuclease n=1 Tax=Flavobacterium cerinum TaxID=2502784 RepID=A0A3S3QM30_9FLAO|nr:very short patch repair endonuclease [Flavobacterium cerinum]RWX02204.1 very short patch repair endonuclease [Flavobacterium cerinum]
MDRHSLEQRSKNMAAIKSTGTEAEIKLGKGLWHLGYRYRKNNKKVFGKPDFTFKKIKIAIFVDSEFFHGKDFLTKKKPISNAEYWENKIIRNMNRDRLVNDTLTHEGWTVVRFWSKEVLNNISNVIEEIEKLYNDKSKKF